MTARELIAEALIDAERAKEDDAQHKQAGLPPPRIAFYSLQVQMSERLARMLQHSLDCLNAFAGVRAEDALVFSREMIAETAKKTLADIEAECE